MSRYSYLKGPFEVSVDVTNKCNLRCLHCYNFSGENDCINDELSEDEIMDLMREVVEMKPLNVCLSGGEPLLRKGLVYKALTLLNDNNIHTSMVSNGLLLDEEVANRLKEAGLNTIQISLDGLEISHDKLRNKNGTFEAVMKCLDILKSKGMSTYIGFAPTKWNIKEFDQVVDIALEKNIKCIRTQYLMPTGRGKENLAHILPDESDYRILVSNINRLKRKIIRENLNLKIEWDDPVQHFYDVCELEDIYPQIHIKSNGNVTKTPYLPIYFGNIRQESFQSLIDRGLLQASSNGDFVDICSKIKCVDDMSLDGLKLPANFKEQDILIEI